MKRIVIIGSGSVAEALVGVLSSTLDSDYALVQVWGRNAERVGELARRTGCAWGVCEADLLPADIYLIAVSDRVIGELANRLSFGNAVVAHTAGSVSLEVLTEACYHSVSQCGTCACSDAHSGARCGVFYPLQSFTSGREIAFSTVPIFVEGATEQVEQELLALGRAISSRVAVLDSQQRERLHLSAVFASNFANRMFALAQELASKQGLPTQWLTPLVEEVSAKAIAASDARLVQTGPALRHDQPTLDRHLALLEQEPELQQIYQLISQNIWETSKKI